MDDTNAKSPSPRTPHEQAYDYALQAARLEKCADFAAQALYQVNLLLQYDCANGVGSDDEYASLYRNARKLLAEVNMVKDAVEAMVMLSKAK